MTSLPKQPVDNPAGDLWIVIPNWDKFQHGYQRSNPWIKLYLELNSKDEWLSLTTAERGMLVTIWVETARSLGALRTSKAMSLCGKSARSKHLRSLNHAGFIKFSASKPSRARSQEKNRIETPKGKTSQTPNGPAAVCPDCGVTYKTQARLAEHRNTVHWVDA